MSNTNLIQVVGAYPGELSEAHQQRFQQDGYVAFENVLSPTEVEEARVALTELTVRLLERAARGEAEVRQNSNATRNYAGVQIADPELGYHIDFEVGFDPLAMPPAEAELKVRKLHSFDQAHPVFTRLATTHERIIGSMGQILGEQVVLKASMALSKPPFIGSEKPWHQDNAYFDFLPLDKVATAWIALDDASVDNGCMHVIRGGHTVGPLRHHHTIDCEIMPDRIDPSQAAPVPLRAGGVMFFSAMLPHQTPPNRTATRRRALQFQYRGVTTTRVSREAFGKVFAEADGTPASCALANENG